LIIAGGAHPTAVPNETLEQYPSFDAIVLREGELTILEIYNRLKDYPGEQTEVFSDVRGIVWRNNQGEIINNGDRELISDLDSLPFADHLLVDWNKYARLYNLTKHKFQRVFPIFASRGCPFSCTFCMPLLTRRHRIRSIDNVLDEVSLLNSKLGAERIYFEDSLFYPRREDFENFCEEYKRRGLHKKVQWGFETRIDTAHPEMFKLAKEAGCIYISFGMESGSEEVLKGANKFYTKDKIIQVLTRCREAGIAELSIGLIIGLPFETKNTINETLSLLKIIPFDSCGVSLLDIYPDTKLFDMAIKGEGGIRLLSDKLCWDDLSRETPAAEVNDLTIQDLIEARNKAIKIIKSNKRANKIELFHKLLAYSIELIKENPYTLFRYTKDFLRGKRS